MKAYKGFNDKLQCTPANKCFQYEVGKTYEEPNADLCHEGFHACEMPLDVFNHYSAADGRFCEVDLGGVSDQKDGDDSKRVGKKITVKAEIGIAGIIKAQFEYINEKMKDVKEPNSGYSGTAANSGDWGTAANSGYRGTAANSGYSGTAANSGNCGTAANSGNCGTAANSGDWGTAANSGYRGTAANSGYRGTAANSGNCGTAANSGNCGTAANSGNWGTAANSGNWGTAGTSGKESVAIVTGYNSKAKASLGNWIVLTERDENYHILGIKAVKADGKKIKADTYYMLKNGKISEVE